MDDVEYRKTVQATLSRIEKAFANVDPDLAECENTLGALTIIFSDKSRCILSAQPSVRQLWLALAAEGTAYHFNFQTSLSEWVDDKGRAVELYSFLMEYLKRKTGLFFHF